MSAELNDSGQYAYYGKVGGGIPTYGNQRSLWEAGCRFDYENPEHR